jgi:hypothetical protein
MSVCQYCNGEMKDEISCRPDALMLGGVTVHPIPWGAEDFSKGRHIDFCCPDCGTPPGGVHHPGCCIERCPGCLGQALGCPCFDDRPDDRPERPLTRVVRSVRYRPLCRTHRFGRHRLP